MDTFLIFTSVIVPANGNEIVEVTPAARLSVMFIGRPVATSVVQIGALCVVVVKLLASENEPVPQVLLAAIRQKYCVPIAKLVWLELSEVVVVFVTKLLKFTSVETCTK